MNIAGIQGKMQIFLDLVLKLNHIADYRALPLLRRRQVSKWFTTHYVQIIAVIKDDRRLIKRLTIFSITKAPGKIKGM